MVCWLPCSYKKNKIRLVLLKEGQLAHLSASMSGTENTLWTSNWVGNLVTFLLKLRMVPVLISEPKEKLTA